MSTFQELGLSPNILKAVSLAGYQHPSPIQERAIPQALAGRDIFGCAQTGTGKTAAFVLPIIHKIECGGRYPQPKKFRALIVTPTRELAEQISANISLYGKFSHITHTKAYGGVSEKPQIKALAIGVDILVATPGRLLDLRNQGALDMSATEFFVLDEADRMLDMGFIHDVRKISSFLPKERQTMLFSATLSAEVQSLAASLVKNPVRIEVSPEKPTVEKIAQSVCFVEQANKLELLEYTLKKRLANPSTIALIFTRTKHGADRVARKLAKVGFKSGVIHGDRTQGARQRALGDFKTRKSRILVATDIAARGIDVKDMPLVINYELPEEAETYVHRIGRTARAEAEGEAISFCCPSETALLRDIQKLIRLTIPENNDNPFVSEEARNAAKNPLIAERLAAAERKRRNEARMAFIEAKRAGRNPAGHARPQNAAKKPNPTKSNPAEKQKGASQESGKGKILNFPKLGKIFGRKGR